MTGNVTAQNWRDYVASAAGSAMQNVFDSALGQKQNDGKTLLQSIDSVQSRLTELNKTLTPYDKQYFDMAANAKSMRDKMASDRMSHLSQRVGMETATLTSLKNDRQNNFYERNAQQSLYRLNQIGSDIRNIESNLAWARSQGDNWRIQQLENDLNNARQNQQFAQNTYNSDRQSADFYNTNLDRRISQSQGTIDNFNKQVSFLKPILGSDYSTNDFNALKFGGVQDWEQLANANVGMQVMQEQAIASRKASGSSIQGALSLSQFNNLSSELVSTTSSGATLEQQVVKAVTDAETGYQQQRKTGAVKAAASKDNKHIPLTGVFGIPDPGVGLQIPGTIQ